MRMKRLMCGFLVGAILGLGVLTIGCVPEQQAQKVDVGTEATQQFIQSPTAALLTTLWAPLGYVLTAAGAVVAGWQKYRGEKYRSAFVDSNIAGTNAPATKNLMAKEGLVVKDATT